MTQEYQTRFEDFTLVIVKIVALALLFQIVLLVITSFSEEYKAVFFPTAENVDNRFCQMFIAIWDTREILIFLYSVDKKNLLDVTFVFFISLLIVAQHVSGNHVPIIRS